MATPPVHERLVAEQAMEYPPDDDATDVTKLRWALLHGQAFTSKEAVARFNVNTTTLSMVIADLGRAGFIIERTGTTDRQLRMRVANLDHTPQPFVSRGKKQVRKKAPKARAMRRGIMADAAAALRQGYPNSVDLGSSKALRQGIYRLGRNHGWKIEKVAEGRYQLVSTPDGVPASTAVEPVAKPPSNGNGHDALANLRAFHREAPVVPPLGTVVRVVMIAEDNGSAAVVLKDMGGRQWFAHVDATPG